MSTPQDGVKRACLHAAIAMPIIYFGAQLAAAPFYPHYSFSQQVASMLGTGNSSEAWVFNVGVMLSGLAAIVGSYGLFEVFRRTAGLVLALLVGLALLALGITSLKSGIYPLPDPRHTSWGFLTVFIILIPLLLLVACWRARSGPALKAYLLFSVVLVAAMAPFMSGVVSAAWLGHGLSQRVFALATLVPVGVTAFAYRRSGEMMRQDLV